MNPERSDGRSILDQQAGTSNCTAKNVPSLGIQESEANSSHIQKGPSHFQINGSKLVSVELISNAFKVGVPTCTESEAEAEHVLAEIRQRCSVSLGILEEDLSFFQLTPLKLPKNGAWTLTQSGSIAVQVNQSGFSLAALEGLLKERSNLSVNLENCTTALESMRAAAVEAGTASASAVEQLKKEQTRSQGLQDYCTSLEGELTMLRQQLTRADELRAHSQRSLEELKGEFETLTKDIADDIFFNSNLKSSIEFKNSLAKKSAGALQDETEEPGGPHSAWWSTISDPRAIDVLERLCSEGTLSQLERIMDKLPVQNTKD